MSELNLDELFEGLSPEDAATLAERIKGRIQQVGEEYRQEKQNAPLDEQEASEMAGLTTRGPINAIQRQQIRRKFAELRNQEETPVDEEIEAIKDDPRALMKLYQSRVAKIKANDPLKLRKRTEIASPFKKLGLNL